MRGRADRFLTGLEAYRAHPYRRDLVDPPTVWEEGGSRLLDFGTGADAGGGRPILVVPSLVNRHYVLDLDADSSLMRYLAGRGLRPYLIDWGSPGPAEAGFALDDYIVRRLGGALDAVLSRSGEAPVLLGYCMGGNLALALAALRPGAFAGLALLATPWDFHAEAGTQAEALATAFEPAWPYFEDLGTVPVDLLQALFAALDPQLALRKFTAFAALDPASPEAARFVALEDWLNDGLALTTPVARDCILGWYGENRPARGEWTVAGMPIDPTVLRLPALVVVPAQDRIVPPASALALAEALPDATLRRPALGHIGMIVGRRARRSVWDPLARWIEEA
ncbi:MAG: alpha/beta fold hydrolase [Proteobacteria bacterium]|nr:alpha/beta fold hydrolase [Pseudomonadota bacterium]